MAGLFDSEVKGVKPATGGTGLFGNSGDFITKERGQILQEHLYNKENANNPFRAIGGALKTYNLQNSPEVQQMRQTDEIMAKYNDMITSQDPAEQKKGWMGISKEVMAIGNIKGGVQAAKEANGITIADPKKDPIIKNFTEGDETVTKRYNHETGQFDEVSRGPRCQDKDPSTIDPQKGWFRETVIDESGKKRRGLFNQEGKLQRYLGYGEESDSKENNGTWVEKTITDKDGNSVGVLYNSTQKKYDVPNLGELSFASMNKLGYDIGKKDPADNAQAKTFLLPNGTYISGAYDPKTQERTYMVNGVATPVPEGSIDVSYRIQQSPSLSYKETTDISEVSGKVEDFVSLIDGFQEGYGGYGLEFIGDAVNWIAKRTGGDATPQAIWWQKHDRLKNQVRHELFGSALTNTEKTAFDKITVNPGLHADVIKANLAEQLTIAKRAAIKIVQAESAKGVPDAQLRAAVGEFVWNMALPPRRMPTKVTGVDEDGVVTVE